MEFFFLVVQMYNVEHCVNSYWNIIVAMRVRGLCYDI